MFHVDVDLGEFRSAATATRNEIVTACYDSARAAAEAGRDEAKAVGPFQDRTGQLRANIRAQHSELTARGGVWEIVSPQSYSLFVEGGTRPHPIVARNAPALTFYWAREGRWFRGPSVNHPGTPALPFMGPAYTKAEAALRAELEKRLALIEARWS